VCHRNYGTAWVIGCCPKVRSNSSLKLKVDFSLEIAAEDAGRLQAELRQALGDLGLKDAVQVEIR